MKPSLAYALALAVLSLVMAWLYGTIDYLGLYANVDLKHYRALAQAVPWWATETPQPFVFRILGPYLVGLLPVPDPLGFRLLTTAGLAVLTVLLFAFLLRDVFILGLIESGLSIIVGSDYD